MVIAGYVATSETWIDFSIEWGIRLKNAGLNYFKMNEMAARPELAGWFYRVIEEYDVKLAISCIVPTSLLMKVVHQIKWPSHIDPTGMENPYLIGMKGIIDGLAQCNDLTGFNEPIDFVFDYDTEKPKAEQAHPLIKKFSDHEDMIGDLAYRDDRNTMPLQAADLYAWWILKWEREGSVSWAEKIPFPWPIKRKIPRLAMRFQEWQLWLEMSRGLAKFARNQEELEYAHSILPNEVRGDKGEDGDPVLDDIVRRWKS